MIDPVFAGWPEVEIAWSLNSGKQLLTAHGINMVRCRICYSCVCILYDKSGGCCACALRIILLTKRLDNAKMCLVLILRFEA